MRVSRYTPEVTIVAAWMSAETGVGPAMASGNHTNRGELSRLAGSAEEQHQGDRRRGRLGEPRRGSVERDVVDRPDGTEGEEHRHHEAEVADAVGDERLLAGAGVGLVGKPEGDEEVGAGADALPAEEGQQEVVAEHEHQHREGEQVQVQEELRELLVTVHVADRVQVDEGSDPRHEQDHRHRQRVDEEAHVDAEVACRHPLEQGLDEAPFLGVAVDQADEDHDGRDERTGHRGGRQPPGAGLTEARSQHQQQQEPGQREGRDEPDRVEHRASPYPFSTETSSAVALGRRRMIATISPSPTTTSAAATTSTKNTAS